MPVVQALSVGNIGGPFLGPQLVSCRSQNGLCWVVPPNDLQLPPSWNPLPKQERPSAPFDTYTEKKAYCEKNPYTSNVLGDGNQWCFYPRKENNYEPSPPKPFEQIVPWCKGPNNCFGAAFQRT